MNVASFLAAPFQTPIVVPANSGSGPAQASTFAASIDAAFGSVLWVTCFLSVLVIGAFGLALLRARFVAGESDAPRAASAWSAVAAFVLVGVCGVQAARAWADVQVPPRGALPIRVALEERGWKFTYPNGVAVAELHLPLDRAARLSFAGGAEPYSFAVPEFRLQVRIPVDTRVDAWVQPTQAGDFSARSNVASPLRAEAVAATVTVHGPGGFEKWYQDVSGPPLDLPPIDLGRRSFEMRGCMQCHTVDGTKLVGPSFKGFATREHRLRDGSVVAPDDAYVAESVLDPQAKVVEGFEPVMPSFKGRLHEKEVAGLAAYLRSLP